MIYYYVLVVNDDVQCCRGRHCLIPKWLTSYYFKYLDTNLFHNARRTVHHSYLRVNDFRVSRFLIFYTAVQ